MIELSFTFYDHFFTTVSITYCQPLDNIRIVYSSNIWKTYYIKGKGARRLKSAKSSLSVAPVCQSVRCIQSNSLIEQMKRQREDDIVVGWQQQILLTMQRSENLIIEFFLTSILPKKMKEKFCLLLQYWSHGSIKKTKALYCVVQPLI